MDNAKEPLPSPPQRIKNTDPVSFFQKLVNEDRANITGASRD